MQVSDDVTTITTRLRNREELMGGAQPLTLCKFVEARVSSHRYGEGGGGDIFVVCPLMLDNRAAALTSQSHVTECFCMAKDHGVQ